jgi:FkbM family methyltransferase
MLPSYQSAFNRALKYKHHVQALGLFSGFSSATFPTRSPLVAAIWEPCPHPIWLRSGTSDMTVFKEVLQEEEYGFNLSAPPLTIIDAGANIGLASIWFATRYPEAKIIAVEAELSNYELMVKNLAPFPNVTPLHAALWSHAGILAITEPNGTEPWAFQTAEVGADWTATRGTVESLTVSDLMSRFGFDEIDLLKIDIEGAEFDVFSDDGCVEWIEAVNAIAIELHDRFRPGCSRAFYSRVDDLKVDASRGANTFVGR